MPLATSLAERGKSRWPPLAPGDLAGGGQTASSVLVSGCYPQKLSLQLYVPDEGAEAERSHEDLRAWDRDPVCATLSTCGGHTGGHWLVWVLSPVPELLSSCSLGGGLSESVPP